MDSFDGVGRDCTARVTEPVRPPARTASFDDVEVPSASATRNSSRRAKTAGAALVLRARKNGGHRQRRFSCPLGVRCLSHDCTIMRGLTRPRKPSSQALRLTMGLTIMKPRTEAPPPPRNGVDTPKLFATIGHVAAQPELAKFQFRTESRWIDGTHSRSAMTTFLGAGGEHSHKSEYAAEADHPAVLCGADQGPTPVEHLLHALSSCLIAGIANVAAARGVTLKRVEAIVEGDIDLRGILGLAEDVRNGYQGIRMSFRISGDASPDKLREIVEQSRARSAVYDVLTKGVPISLAVDAEN